jgi:hypothetical protein
LRFGAGARLAQKLEGVHGAVKGALGSRLEAGNALESTDAGARWACDAAEICFEAPGVPHAPEGQGHVADDGRFRWISGT